MFVDGQIHKLIISNKITKGILSKEKYSIIKSSLVHLKSLNLTSINLSPHNIVMDADAFHPTLDRIKGSLYISGFKITRGFSIKSWNFNIIYLKKQICDQR